MRHTKQLYRVSLAIYLLFLSWLILFKTSSDPFSVLANYHSRSLNLVPFAGYSSGALREMVDNLIVFVPLGLLLGSNFKQVNFWRKLAYVFVFSMTVETLQFILAIGTSDITDVITNTLGGCIGLAAYRLVGRYIDDKKLDRCIIIVLAVLLVALNLLRFLVFRVRY